MWAGTGASAVELAVAGAVVCGTLSIEPRSIKSPMVGRVLADAALRSGTGGSENVTVGARGRPVVGAAAEEVEDAPLGGVEED